MYERIKRARKTLRLTQDFVARHMGMSRITVMAIESGKREVSAKELSAFSSLYGVPMEELLNGATPPEGRSGIFDRAFSELSEMDQDEIISLMKFKKRYKESLHA